MAGTKHRRVPVVVPLALFLMAYVLNQWDRYLFNYLSAFQESACDAVCKSAGRNGSRAVSVCTTCDAGDGTCAHCVSCLSKHHSPDHNIQAATCITPVEYGLLSGVGFVAIYIALGFLAGALVDRYPRVRVLVGGLFVWSLATIGEAAVRSFWDLLAVRVFLGFGEAFASPAVYSMIPDMVRPQWRSFANAVFTVGIYFGGGMASVSIVLAAWMGWRHTVLLLGIAGVVLAVLIVACVREPRRDTFAASDATLGTGAEQGPDGGERSRLIDAVGGASVNGGSASPLSPTHGAIVAPVSTTPSHSASVDKSRGDVDTTVAVHLVQPQLPPLEPMTLWQVLTAMWQAPGVPLLLFGSSVRYFGGYSIASFNAKYFGAEFPHDGDAFGYATGVLIFVGGSISTLGGGWLADRAGTLRGRATVPAIGQLLSIPAYAACMLWPSFWGAIVCLFIEYLLAECWIGPIMSLLQHSLPNRALGTATAVFVALTTIVGSMAPLLIGALRQADGSVEMLRWALLLSVAASYLVSSMCFVASGHRMQVAAEGIGRAASS